MKQCDKRINRLNSKAFAGSCRMLRWGLAFVFVILGLNGQGQAFERVVGLQDSLRLLVDKRDSLGLRQRRLQASADSLANTVIRLKNTHAGGAAEGELALALRQSLKLTLVLEETYGLERNIRQNIARIRLQLREAYDTEISRLILALTENPDSNFIVQIQKLRAQRQSVEAIEHVSVLPTVMIGADDTPKDIRLKTELMADVALQLQKENHDIDQQIKRLVDEQRLRARSLSFTSEFGLFDETSPQGRSVSASPISPDDSEPLADQREPNTERIETVPPGFDFEGIAGAPSLPVETEIESEVAGGVLVPSARVGREVILDGLTGPNGEPLDELGLEIRKLQIRQQELVEKEKKVQDRVLRLKIYLKQLLEGQAP